MLSALLFGLLSSLHCVGMCGPIAMMLPVHKSSATKKVIQIMLYHLGRILSYGFLGLMFGWLGKGLFIAGFQQGFSIFIGVLMVVYILLPKNRFQYISFLKPVYKTVSQLKTYMGLQFKKTGYTSLFMIGLINGFLPCAMIYVALFGATATQDPYQGALFMMLFGLGTLPLMSAVVYISNAISVASRNKILKFVPVFVVILGLLFIVRGLGLDISFLSPGTLQLFVSAKPDCF